MSIERKGDNEVTIFNALSDTGYPLRIERERGILHIGVVTSSYGTHWTDIDIDSLLEGLVALGISIELP